MNRTAVSSANIKSAGYDPLSQTMEIEFHNGEIYHYPGTAPEDYQGLIMAPSSGRYFHQYIKPQGGKKVK